MNVAETAGTHSSFEGLRARQVALELLHAVLQRRQTLDQALDRVESFKSLPLRDRSFCRMLVSTTLRRLGQIDDLITKAEDRPSSRNMGLQNILRIGTVQIMFMDVPDHAAVDTTVNLAIRAGMDRQKGFVNGVLRNLARVGQEWKTRQDEGRLNTPEWLLKIWIAEYGLKTAANIAKANLAEAPLDITIKNENDRAYWNNAFKATEVGAGTLRKVAGGNVTTLEGFEEGRWWVQDASAALPATLLGDIKDKTVIDLCAAPGGKTMQLAARGANVIAVDRSAQRLRRLHENLNRVGLIDKVDVVVSDATQWRPRDYAPDLILLDAPCSATGTLRRNPDVAHLKTQQDLERLINVQHRILDNAFDMLAPGGTLVYCTCSLQKSEGEHQIERLISERPASYKAAIETEEIGLITDAITENGDVRLLPFHQAALGGMDGFFISRLRKAG